MIFTEISKESLLELIARVDENRESGGIWSDQQVIEFWAKDNEIRLTVDRCRVATNPIPKSY